MKEGSDYICVQELFKEFRGFGCQVCSNSTALNLVLRIIPKPLIRQKPHPKP